MRATITTLISAALVAAFLSVAWAHGDAMWIQNEPRYKRPDGITHCCSPAHCHRITDRNAVKVTADGYLLTWLNQTVPFDWRSKYTSIDEFYWICLNGATVHCFFAPNAGS